VAAADPPLDYRVRRSDRARRVRVRVDAAHGIEVVLPRRAPERAAAAAVRELRPWIERRVAELARTAALVAARGASVPYLDATLALEAEPGRTRVHRRGDGTGARRVPRSARGSTVRPRSPARATGA
jgi:predicted metal-dependent hydrolase